MGGHQVVNDALGHCSCCLTGGAPDSLSIRKAGIPMEDGPWRGREADDATWDTQHLSQQLPTTFLAVSDI